MNARRRQSAEITYFGIEKIDRFDKHAIFVKQKPPKRFGLDSRELFGIIKVCD